VKSLRRLLPVVAIVVIGVLFAFNNWKPVAVTVTPVVRGRAIDAVYATGTVEAEDRVQVKAKSSGSILEILVKEGASVKKGDLLARIDNPAVSYDLKRGQADLSAAAAQSGANAPQLLSLRGQWQAVHADLESARQDAERIDQLAKTGSISQAEVDRGHARVAQLEGTLAANEAQQRSVRIDLSANTARQAANVQSLASRVSDTEVRAPIDGVVLAKSVEIGEVVVINQPLFKVGDVRELILEVSVDEADIGRVRDGRGSSAPSVSVPAEPPSARQPSVVAVSLYAFPKQILQGHVFEVLPDANRDRKAFLVKVNLDAPPEGLRSGMSAEVNIVAGEHDGALLAGTESVTDDGVWLVRDGRARRQPVKLGYRDLLRAEVLTGLAEGDLVVVNGQDKLSEGARVAAVVRTPDKFEPMPDRSQPGQTSIR
jgi:HlyD family secretion protein